MSQMKAMTVTTGRFSLMLCEFKENYNHESWQISLMLWFLLVG